MVSIPNTLQLFNVAMELHHLEERTRTVHHHFHYRSRWAIQIFTIICAYIHTIYHTMGCETTYPYHIWAVKPSSIKQLCKPSNLSTGSQLSPPGAGGCGVPDLLRRKLCCLAVVRRDEGCRHEAAGQTAEDRLRKKDLYIWGPGAWSGFFPWDSIWDLVDFFKVGRELLMNGFNKGLGRARCTSL